MKSFKRLLALLLAVMMLVPAASAEEGLLILPAGLKRIEDQAFYGVYDIAKVIVPEGTESIGSEAFAWSSLREITLPASVTFIADDAFEGCWQVAVTAPEGSYAREWAKEQGLPITGVTAAPTSAPTPTPTATQTATPTPTPAVTPTVTPTAAATATPEPDLSDTPVASFRYTLSNGNCIITGFTGSETDIRIPAFIENCPVVKVGSYAFYNNATIHSVVIPNSVQAVATYAFGHCNSLKSVTLPSSLNTLDDFAFASCTSLENISIPYGTKTIGIRAFTGCSALQELSIPGSVTTIELAAFEYCSGLKKVLFSSGVTTIADSMFSHCTNLTAVYIPSSVTTISNNAFASCSSLQKISIPSSVSFIGYHAFYGCRALDTVVLSHGVASLGKAAFGYCTSLEEITIPGSVSSVEDTFEYCSSLKRVYFADGVQSLNGYLFRSCTALEQIVITGSVTYIDYGIDIDAPQPISVYASAGTYAYTWFSKFSQYTVIDSILDIPTTGTEPLPEEYYEVIRKYCMDGQTYIEATLIRDYNGVSAGTSVFGRYFFMNEEGKVITDAATLSKLFTVSMYASTEDTIRNALSGWKTASTTWTECVVDFLNGEEASKLLGNFVATSIKGFLGNWIGVMTDINKYLSDKDTLKTLGLVGNIRNLTNHLWDMTDVALAYPTRNDSGYYDYHKAAAMLEYYGYCYVYYKAAQSLCMPIIDNILQKYSDGWDLNFDRMIRACLSFGDSAVTSEFPFMGPTLKCVEAWLLGDDAAESAMSILMACITEDAVSIPLNAFAGSLMALSDVTGVDPSLRDELLDPFYLTVSEMENTQLYANHQLLAQ